jgi:rRNA processing protein Gar1
VLLLQDKTPIGRIEEVFGPVTEPLYAMRYAGPQPPPEGLARDARVFFTDALAQLVEDDVYTTGAALSNLLYW